MSDLAVILSTAVVTYTLRVSFVALLGGWTLRPWLQESIRLVRPAALAALTVAVLASHVAFDLPHLAGIAAAGMTASRRGGLVGPLTVGMAVLMVLTVL